MTRTLRLTTTMLRGRRIELVNRALPEREEVQVPITDLRSAPPGTRSAVEILARAPGGRLFRSAAEVDTYLRAERAS